jgi:CheY-like chemotaxis protein
VTQLSDPQVPVNGRILVAEDDPISQFVVKRILDQAGYEADLVGDGKGVIVALESKNYDLVLMDCLMPQMDGFAATRFIRKTVSAEFDSQIPIIALTGLTANADRSKCLDAGMNSVICKPVDAKTLIAAIEQCLQPPGDEETSLLQSGAIADQSWDDGFLNTIIDKFLAEAPQVIDDLQTAIAQRDPVKLQNIGHRLRGAADILEASTLSALSRALEQVAKKGNIQVSSKLASELIRELQKFVAVLTE